MTDDREAYRRIIDELVCSCRSGQGTVSARRVRGGVWNANITKKSDPEQYEYNELLKRLTPEHREAIARLLEHEFEDGVFAALEVLHRAGIGPFDRGYEGAPSDDFVGRLGGWNWPV